MTDTPTRPDAPPAGDTLQEALADLLSWFDGGPSDYGPWIIRAGEQGADNAVEAARAALAAAPQPATEQALREMIRGEIDIAYGDAEELARALIADGWRKMTNAPPATPGQRMIRAAEEATAIARGEAAPANVYPALQPVCCLCDDRPQAPDNPCGACGKTAPQPETLAWAVIDDDGMPSLVNYDRLTAVHLAGHGEQVVRVSIRVVEDEA